MKGAQGAQAKEGVNEIVVEEERAINSIGKYGDINCTKYIIKKEKTLKRKRKKKQEKDFNLHYVSTSSIYES